MNLTFRTRLIFWYVLAFAVLLTLAAAALIYALDYQAQKKFDAALYILGTSEAEQILANLQNRGVRNLDDKTIVDNRYGELFGSKNKSLEKYVTVADADGRAVDFSENLPAPLPFDNDSLRRALDGEAVYQTLEPLYARNLRVVYIPVRATDFAPKFVVITGLPEDFISGDIQSFRLISAFGIFIFLGLATLSAYALVKQVVRPIEKVAAAAESVTSQNLQDRIPEQAADDQIGHLIKVYNQMLARLDNAFESQRRFATRAAHELRTPLTILQGEIQVTLRRRRTIKEYETQLRSNLEEVEKMTGIIDELLTLARYESGETEMPRRRLRLDEIAAVVVKDLSSVAENGGKQFVFETVEAEVFGDEQALVRLVSNFVENAIYYTPDGGRIRVEVAVADKSPMLVIEDTGIGIAPEDLPHIFERLFRSKQARRMRPKGVGIGLAMANVIARLHNAQIRVQTNSPNGTRFIIIFSPLSEEPNKILD